MSEVLEGARDRVTEIEAGTAMGATLDGAEQRALARTKPTLTNVDLADLAEFGEVVARSGKFEGMKTTAQAVVQLAIGRELGLTKTASLTGVYVFTTKDGTKVVIAGQLLLAKINDHPRYRVEILRSDTEACYIQPWKRGGLFGDGDEWKRVTPVCRASGCDGGRLVVAPEGTNGTQWCQECYGTGFVPVKFTITDAKRLELLSKNNWKGDPESMLLWRCLAKTQRRYFGDVLAIGQAYVEGELMEEEIILPAAMGAVRQADAAVQPVSVARPRRVQEPPPENVIDAEEVPAPPPTDDGAGAGEHLGEEPPAGNDAPPPPDGPMKKCGRGHPDFPAAELFCPKCMAEPVGGGQ